MGDKLCTYSPDASSLYVETLTHSGKELGHWPLGNKPSLHDSVNAELSHRILPWRRADHMFSTIRFNRRQARSRLTDIRSASAHRMVFPASRAMRNSQVLLEQPRLWYLITASQTKISWNSNCACPENQPTVL